tara:strand:- start:818 stop:2812 length:1995 start_codon:yes stop_codon:yes gene_type:complete
MATYVNNLRLKEITTGDEDGTWGTSTNTNLELITDGFSLGTKQMAADANETFTMPDATADATRSLYLKITSAASLTATREVTLGPNTVSKTWIIENATTGSQIITIKQGSGATVNIPNGSKVLVVTDGAGAGAAVFNANPTEVGGTVTSVGGTGTVNGITLTGTVTSSGNLTLGGALTGVDLTSQVTGNLPLANGGTGASLVDPDADRIFFWDDSAGSTAFLTVGSGLQISGTTLSSTDAGGTVTSVAVSGGTTGLTTSGGPVTGSGTITLAGTLGEENGGTGLTGYTTGDIVYASGTDTLAKLGLGSATQVLKVNSGGTQVEWADSDISIETVNRTSDTTLTAANNSNFIDITSGTFTQTFTSAATLGNGWFCYIRNSGTGDITLDPDGSETIDGLTTFVMYPQEVRLIKSDGTNLTSTVLTSFYKTFTATGTFTKPPGYASLAGMLWGGGGAGGLSNYTAESSGGGGACNLFNVPSSTLSASSSVVIAAGGAAQTTAGSAAASGGTSSLDSKIYAYGGGGGITNSFSETSASGGGGGGVVSAGSDGLASASARSAGGEPSPGTLESDLDNSGFGGASSAGSVNGFAFAGGGGGGGSSISTGGTSVYGGGGGGSTTGGTSLFGGDGGSGEGGDGVIPAGGGSGSGTSPSGAGARGELRIWGTV